MEVNGLGRNRRLARDSVQLKQRVKPVRGHSAYYGRLPILYDRLGTRAILFA